MSPALSYGTKIDTLTAAARASGLFDRDFYVARYADVRQAGVDPVLHYLRHGEREGRLPCALFDPAWYREKSGIGDDLCALLHYAQAGCEPVADPSPHFSGAVYRAVYPDVAASGENPLRHYLAHGRSEGRHFFRPLRADEEMAETAELLRAVIATGLVDSRWYLTTYYDLSPIRHSAVDHFARDGWREGRKANPWFDTGFYGARYKALIGAEMPLLHYAREGWKLGLVPSRDFSPRGYLNHAPDLIGQDIEPLAHYLKHGRDEGRHCPHAAGDRDFATGIVHKGARATVPDGLVDMARWPRKDLAPASTAFNPTRMELHWVIPDFSPGGGGHMTIFRMISALEHFGHKQTVWINRPKQHRTPEDAFDDINKYFQHFTGAVRFVDDTLMQIEADAVIATDWASVWPILSAERVKRRFYFVQDHEPSFFPVGALSLAAEETYRQDLDCLCASPWLADKMQRDYGRWARPFNLAANPVLYHPPSVRPVNTIPRVAFYARGHTARRAVDLGLLALDALAAAGTQFHVDFFGDALPPLSVAAYSFTHHGIASADQLAAIFQEADIGVVFSATNYSLVPQEMMACGLPILELDGPNTRAIFPQDCVRFVRPDPLAIAEGLKFLINTPNAREAQRAAALRWVASFSWEKSARMVEQAITERLSDRYEARLTSSPVTAAATTAATTATGEARAAVIIPTLNAGPLFERVLDAVCRQQTPFPFEIAVIDSGSEDGTVELVQKRAAQDSRIQLYQIEKSQFNHGDTRNLGMEVTSAPYGAFLTHDALPAGPHWLANMVSMLDKYPQAAGAFGRHLAWPAASAFTKRDMRRHFRGFEPLPLLVSRDTDPDRYETDTRWRQRLHFYSDNNSCMRRSVWQDIPYRRTQFGEDQLWARDVIEAGHAKLYVPQAVVFHSHDYDEAETRERAATESAFFKHFFGYRLMEDEATLETVLQSLNQADEAWASGRGLPADALETQKKLNKAKLQGYLDGATADTAGLF